MSFKLKECTALAESNIWEPRSDQNCLDKGPSKKDV